MSRLLVLPSVAALLIVSFAACSKGESLEKLRADGFSCTKAGAGGGFMIKPGEHCFVCPDDASMSKCSANPVGSGCKEDPNGCGRAAK